MIHWTDEQDRMLKDRQEKNLDRICWWVIGLAVLYVGAHLAFQAYMWNWPPASEYNAKTNAIIEPAERLTKP